MTTTRPTFDDFVAWLEDGRSRGQVHFDDRARCWNVMGHAETNAALSDPGRFSSDLTSLQPDQDDFELFQRGEGAIAYVVFDLLELDGEPLIGEPWSRRRALLEQLIEPGAPIVVLSRTR